MNIKNNQEGIILEIQGDKIILENFNMEQNAIICTCYINEMSCIYNILSNLNKIDSSIIIENTIVDDDLLVFMSSEKILNISLISNSSSLLSFESFNIPKNTGVSSYRSYFFTFGGLLSNTLDNT